MEKGFFSYNHCGLTIKVPGRWQLGAFLCECGPRDISPRWTFGDLYGYFKSCLQVILFPGFCVGLFIISLALKVNYF